MSNYEKITFEVSKRREETMSEVYAIDLLTKEIDEMFLLLSGRSDSIGYAPDVLIAEYGLDNVVSAMEKVLPKVNGSDKLYSFCYGIECNLKGDYKRSKMYLLLKELANGDKNEMERIMQEIRSYNDFLRETYSNFRTNDPNPYGKSNDYMLKENQFSIDPEASEDERGFYDLDNGSKLYGYLKLLQKLDGQKKVDSIMGAIDSKNFEEIEDVYTGIVNLLFSLSENIISSAKELWPKVQRFEHGKDRDQALTTIYECKEKANYIHKVIEEYYLNQK